MVTPSTCQVSQLTPSSGLPCRHDRSSIFFKWKINHNSVNLYRIPTKICTGMHYNKLFMSTKFQLNQSMHSHVMAKDAKRVK